MLAKGGYDMFAGIFGSGPASPTFAASLRSTLEDATSGQRASVLSLTMSAPPEIVRSYEDKGFLVFEDGTALVNALAALVHFRRSFDRPDGAIDQTRRIRHAEAIVGPLSEHQAKQILEKADIAFPREALVTAGKDAGEIAGKIGFPVVMKICSPDIQHKTEIGGVIVGIASAEAARDAADRLLANARKHCPAARIEGILVSPMIAGGVETIADVVRDPVFGPVVMFGLGGLFVEVLKDVTFRVAPFDVEEARCMIREIRGYAILDGARGAAPADVNALAHMLAALSHFASANAGAIESIDLNPVRVMSDGQGVVPLDALLVTREPLRDDRMQGV
jgi:acetate---CoA ligase (ADP-forming)